MNTPLSGKTALVTGATRGIGQAVAVRLMADGATVIGTGASPGGEVSAGIEYKAVDFSDARATEEFAADVLSIAPDILVNNAGINKISPFIEIDIDDFLRIQQINVVAPFQLCQAVVPGMAAKNWGRIINISSIWGKIAKEQRASYATSKFGLDGLTCALAAEVASKGILANCVAPGFIDTEMTRTVLGEQGITTLTSRVPAGRLGTAQEIAALVAWLAGPENTYISGQNIAIDGGFTRV